MKAYKNSPADGQAPSAFRMCKILLEGQMSEKKWEDALSFKCTLVGEYI
ncbi:hypothetical protein B4098_0265 [Heyndrickxia coagulans]|uniref:Uncharacterized protein n=1 Tax=Heyndrickxia coagulans TaxID=1398 RepID=A0A150K719_HEYCO|nr:hypothetical protein B4098_0265 [Heyndrickxia coagulans]